MALEKAFIQPINGKSGGRNIAVLFNPTEYSLETSNQFQRTAVPEPVFHPVERVIRIEKDERT